jgi:hypothetical protein
MPSLTEPDRDDGVLFVDFDAGGAVRAYERILHLSAFADELQAVTPDGCCRYCGYDRGVDSEHPDVDSQLSVNCQRCERYLGA